jgi:hypothetical protein
MDNITQATPESVWAALRELAASQAENARQMKENERFLTEKQAETDRQIAELTRSQADFTKSQVKTENFLKTLGRRLGGMGNSHGSFAEEYFFNAFEDGETDFFGEKFDEISKNLTYKRNGLTDEYDVVMFNHSSVAIVEVKYRADKDDLPSVLKKADTFRKLAPEYNNYKIYLGLASMTGFDPEVEKGCKLNGIAIIKQVGDNVVIIDENLKMF